MIERGLLPSQLLTLECLEHHRNKADGVAFLGPPADRGPANDLRHCRARRAMLPRPITPEITSDPTINAPSYRAREPATRPFFATPHVRCAPRISSEISATSCFNDFTIGNPF